MRKKDTETPEAQIKIIALENEVHNLQFAFYTI